MPSQPFNEIISAVPHRRAGPQRNPAVTGISWDSRRVQRGDLFVALVGMKSDGHQYLKAAAEKGAAALLVEKDAGLPDLPAAVVPSTHEALSRLSVRFYGDPSSEVAVVGVTGTNGKTTITYMLESIWKKAGLRPGVIGTIDYRWGSHKESASNTTPLSADVQRLLHGMKRDGATHAAMEVSSHALAMGRVDEVHFQAGIFTNLTQDHLDYHKDMESYFAAKAKLFDLLFSAGGKALPKLPPCAVINQDDPWAEKFKKHVTGRLITYAIEKPADLRAKNVALSAEKSDFVLSAPEGEFPVHMQIVARYNIYNALAAAGAALSLGISVDDIQKGLADLSGVPGRLERVTPREAPYAIFVDYAHTDDALRNVISTLRPITRGRLVTLFGCGGDRDRTKRPIMGESAVKLSDHVVVTSDNPRSEDPVKITQDIEAGIRKTGLGRYEVIVDREKAIGHAVSMLKDGDVLLLAGKGHEAYQIVGDKYLPFDDREVARQLIGRKK